MSEDDIDIIGQDGQGSARVDRDRRAPRFSWTPSYETTFFRSLCDSVQLGLRENSSFKAEAWERAAQALQDSHGAYPAKSHLINKSDNARKRFRLWRGLREDADFAYNPTTKTVSATEEAWRAHIEREPLSRALRGRPFDHEEYMEILYPDVIGSGGAPKRIMKPRRRADGQPCDDADMPGTGVLNLQTDAPSGQASLDSPSLAKASSPSQTPTGSSSSGSATQQRPASMGLPSTTPTGQASALTPPDDSVSQHRKRTLTMSSVLDHNENSRPLSNSPSTKPTQPSSPEKRRRTSSNDETTLPSVNTLNSSVLPTPGVTLNPINLNPISSWAQTEGRIQAVLDEIVDILKARGSRRWREEAIDLFFKDFPDEDPDLQIKVTETILSDEHKAMLFCKMPSKLRKHWVKRLGESRR
ncbi:L10-interacting MYB domain-containing-like protein [Cladobotryum mycophilum]|uniref:L10-interacting MYB domain-containing-like protein n=1 Tax=Cladobotryum mycophilum TaxID=491253 RepID=A0ABR0SXG5_9HYPO